MSVEQDVNSITTSDARRITVAVIGTLLGVATIVIILGVMLRVSWTEPVATGLKTPEQRLEILNRVRAEDQRALTTYGWVDQNQKIVRIPVEAAIEKYLAEQANGGTGGSPVFIKKPTGEPPVPHVPQP